MGLANFFKKESTWIAGTPIIRMNGKFKPLTVATLKELASTNDPYELCRAIDSFVEGFLKELQDEKTVVNEVFLREYIKNLKELVKLSFKDKNRTVNFVYHPAYYLEEFKKIERGHIMTAGDMLNFLDRTEKEFHKALENKLIDPNLKNMMLYYLKHKPKKFDDTIEVVRKISKVAKISETRVEEEIISLMKTMNSGFNKGMTWCLDPKNSSYTFTASAVLIIGVVGMTAYSFYLANAIIPGIVLLFSFLIILEGLSFSMRNST